jgi:Tol biopolymer transport system component
MSLREGTTTMQKEQIMRARTIIALFLAITLTALGATRSPRAASNNGEVIAQSTISMLTGTTQQIKVAPGDQTNPHVACNIATYTDDDFQGNSIIKYFDFATNTEHTIPGNGLDRLSDTDGQRVAFDQLELDGDHIRVYDIVSQTITQVPGAANSDPAIGGNLVAFLHADAAHPTTPNTFEIGVYDQNTGTVTQLTNDTLEDKYPAVSPDGHVVVWAKCQANNTDCDIYAATQTGPGAFITQLLTGAGDDRFPDTNGQIVVYTSDKSGENDIYFQRLGSSTEMHLSIPGDQRDVTISGNLIAFESGSPLNYDIFVYDLTAARLYQVTDTPNDNETLTDLVAGCNGTNRIIYARAGGFGDFDVWGFTFQLNDSVATQLNDLIALVQSFNLHDGTEASLISKVQDAIAAVNASNTATACDSLTAFINATQAQSGKKLTADQAKQLVDAATLIKSDLGCQ